MDKPKVSYEESQKCHKLSSFFKKEEEDKDEGVEKTKKRKDKEEHLKGNKC